MLDGRLLILHVVYTDGGYCLFYGLAAIRLVGLYFGRGFFFLVVTFKLVEVVIARTMAAVVEVLVLMSYLEVLLHVHCRLLAVRICEYLELAHIELGVADASKPIIKQLLLHLGIPLDQLLQPSHLLFQLLVIEFQLLNPLVLLLKQPLCRLKIKSNLDIDSLHIFNFFLLHLNEEDKLIDLILFREKLLLKLCVPDRSESGFLLAD